MVRKAFHRCGCGWSKRLWKNVRSFSDQSDHKQVRTSFDLLADLKACSSLRNLRRGKRAHAAAVESGDDSNIFVANTLVSMYGKCGSVDDSRRVFDGIQTHDLVSWNSMILGYTENGEAEIALRLFSCMKQEGCSPDSRTYVAALKACSSLGSREVGKQEICLRKGRILHSQAASRKGDLDMFVSNTLVDMYAKCGSLGDARGVFDRMPVHSVVSWTALILGYVENVEEHTALELFSIMTPEPNPLTFVAALKACSGLAVREKGRQDEGLKFVKTEALGKGREIHAQSQKFGCDTEEIVSNTLLDMYAKCGSLVDAHRIFDSVQSRTAVTWNVLILGYVDNGESEAALELFDCMRERSNRGGCSPDARTFVAALKACASLADSRKSDGKLVKPRLLARGTEIHVQAAKKGFTGDVFVATALVDMFAKCGSMADAKKVSDETLHKDVVSWTTLILGYAENGQGELGLQSFERMQREGCAPNARTIVAALKACTSLVVAANDEESKQIFLQKGMAIHSEAVRHRCDFDAYVANTLVDFYSKCGRMGEAQKVFDEMIRHDVVSWTALILGYAENGDPYLALKLFSIMNCRSNSLTLAAAIKACGNLVALAALREIHAELCERGVEADSFLATCLVDAYGKCGSVLDAQQVFDFLPAADCITWTALIAGYSRQGDSGKVFELFHGMIDEGLQANAVTFICIFSVCSHAGLVERGRSYFKAMSSEFGVRRGREHYLCMVDILGRSNRLEDAMRMIKEMEEEGNGEASGLTWRTVLSACRKWKNAVLGRAAFEELLKIDPKDAAAYMLMSNTYGSLELWEEQVKIDEMRRKLEV